MIANPPKGSEHILLIYLQMLESDADKHRFEQLYHRYRRLMFYVARQILPSDEDAEDAVHEAFVAIIRHFESVSDVSDSKTRAFVVLIAERKAIDLRRSNARRGTLPLEENCVGITIPPPGDGGLADAMAQLKPRWRELLLLRYYVGYSTREAAQLLGMTPAAAHKELTRAKTALRAILEEEGAE